MAELYDKTTAIHYAAYRPQLHEPILRSCLGEKKFEHGLDIGCGTGVSSIALKRFCKAVTAVDPNKKMLSQAVTENNISYQLMVNNKLPFTDHSFDICTYAGAWWYGKSQTLLDETIRVSSTNGTILLYDFKVNFNNIYDNLGLLHSDLKGYEHSSNFEKLDTSAFRFISKKIKDNQLLLSPKELAHLLCSQQDIYKQLILKFSNDNTFDQLVQYIKDNIDPSRITVKVLIYYTLYQL
ncbi:MAG: ubiquinone/menaquinone biosynthesis C-methylase UbiE [Maribacter sp.]|jgi:ubiquinone/menaquinone biosynthesis C-methylase UbiE